jgi:uncharacterized membrane protein YtjA (UPF0391 family)
MKAGIPREPALCGCVFLTNVEVLRMFAWVVTFFILAAAAVYLGLSGLGGLAAVIVQLLLMLFLILMAAGTLVSLMQDEPPL